MEPPRIISKLTFQKTPINQLFRFARMINPTATARKVKRQGMRGNFRHTVQIFTIPRNCFTSLFAAAAELFCRPLTGTACCVMRCVLLCVYTVGSPAADRTKPRTRKSEWLGQTVWWPLYYYYYYRQQQQRYTLFSLIFIGQRKDWCWTWDSGISFEHIFHENFDNFN